MKCLNFPRDYLSVGIVNKKIVINFQKCFGLGDGREILTNYQLGALNNTQINWSIRSFEMLHLSETICLYISNASKVFSFTPENQFQIWKFVLVLNI